MHARYSKQPFLFHIEEIHDVTKGFGLVGLSMLDLLNFASLEDKFSVFLTASMVCGSGLKNDYFSDYFECPVKTCLVLCAKKIYTKIPPPTN